MRKIYAGIGSRTTPQIIQLAMFNIASALCSLDYILRSGAAPGADNAFERGCDLVDASKKEIMLPEKRFQSSRSTFYHINDDAIKMALKYHPNPKWLKNTKRILNLMARNCYQVLGYPNLDEPVSFVVCWTQDGCEDGTKTTKATGGTGQALRIATDYDIPIFNLKNDKSLDELFEYSGIDKLIESHENTANRRI